MSDLMIEKKSLTDRQLLILQTEMSKRSKSKGIAFALWFFLGLFGAHRFYCGHVGRGLLLLCFGWLTLGIWPLIDVFFVNGSVEDANDEIERDIIRML